MNVLTSDADFWTSVQFNSINTLGLHLPGTALGVRGGKAWPWSQTACGLVKAAAE